MKRIVIEPVERSGPHGDRDPGRHSYRDYRIHVLRDDERPCKKTSVHVVDGFDHWWTAIKNRQEVEREARKYARRLARILGAAGIIMMKQGARA